MEARNLHFKLGKGHIEDVLESEAKYLLVHVRTLSAYGDVLIAQQRILNTIGKDDLKDFYALPTEELEPVSTPKTIEVIPLSKSSLADLPEAATKDPVSESVQPSETDTIVETEASKRTADDDRADQASAEAQPGAPSITPTKKIAKAIPEIPATVTAVPIRPENQANQQAVRTEPSHGSTPEIPATVTAVPVRPENQANQRAVRTETGHGPTKAITGTDTGQRQDWISNFPYSLHLSSLKSLEGARKLLSFHKKKGLLAYAARVNLGEKGIWWRIFIGYYRTWQEAERADVALGLADARIMETPFANLIGIYSNASAARAMSLKLEKWGYFPYTIKLKNGTLALLTGVYETIKEAAAQKRGLRSKGIQAQVVRR